MLIFFPSVCWGLRALTELFVSGDRFQNFQSIGGRGNLVYSG